MSKVFKCVFFVFLNFLYFDIALQLLPSWWRQDAYGGERKGPKPGALTLLDEGFCRFFFEAGGIKLVTGGLGANIADIMNAGVCG